ncbi:MAG: hypothetical protein LBS51_02185 [Oscillospiraceae bacterium]|jgi:hypothetical protein|nr:hypothetical protein [Oscillospiraceae bacterium]
MSLKGIDAQIMVTRTTDASRESSRMAYRGELAQDYLSVQARVESDVGRERVAKTTKPEQAEFHPDDGGGSGAADDGGADAGGGEQRGASTGDEYLVPAEEHIIDIRI